MFLLLLLKNIAQKKGAKHTKRKFSKELDITILSALCQPYSHLTHSERREGEAKGVSLS